MFIAYWEMDVYMARGNNQVQKTVLLSKSTDIIHREFQGRYYTSDEYIQFCTFPQRAPDSLSSNFFPSQQLWFDCT